MPRFSDIVMDHFLDPRHRGRLDAATHVGLIGTPGRGPFFLLQLRIEQQQIREARFDCNACGATIACGSLLTDWLQRRSIEEGLALTSEQFLDLTGGLPPDKQHCIGMALQALRLALATEQNSRKDPA